MDSVSAALSSSSPVCQSSIVCCSQGVRGIIWTVWKEARRNVRAFGKLWRALSKHRTAAGPLCLLRYLVLVIFFILSWLWSACLSSANPLRSHVGGWCCTQLKAARFRPEQHLLANSFPSSCVCVCVCVCVWIQLVDTASALCAFVLCGKAHVMRTI